MRFFQSRNKQKLWKFSSNRSSTPRQWFCRPNCYLRAFWIAALEVSANVVVNRRHACGKTGQYKQIPPAPLFNQRRSPPERIQYRLAVTPVTAIPSTAAPVRVPIITVTVRTPIITRRIIPRPHPSRPVIGSRAVICRCRNRNRNGYWKADPPTGLCRRQRHQVHREH